MSMSSISCDLFMKNKDAALSLPENLSWNHIDGLTVLIHVLISITLTLQLMYLNSVTTDALRTALNGSLCELRDRNIEKIK